MLPGLFCRGVSWSQWVMVKRPDLRFNDPNPETQLKHLRHEILGTLERPVVQGSPFFSTYLLNKKYISLTNLWGRPPNPAYGWHGLCENRFLEVDLIWDQTNLFNVWMSLLSDLYTGDLPLTKILFNWIHLSHEKNPYYFPLYCLFNRDPYNGVL